MKTLIRLHQVLVLLAILSGCYSPELSDCTVTCGGQRRVRRRRDVVRA